MINPTYVKHFANAGDAVAVMAGLQRYHERTGKKIVFCQQINVLASYYNGATHPTLDEQGRMVMVNAKMWEMLKPLIEVQPYIERAERFNGQKINIDLDRIRGEIFVNMPHQAIQQWIFLCYPDISADLTKIWLHIDETKVDISDCKLIYPRLVATEFPITNLKDKIILNFTERYRNERLHYFFLKEYKENLLFAGTEIEYEIFTKKWELEIPYIKINNFLQLASIIKQSKFLLSNQSLSWNIAEAMKTPRVLELCDFADNCQAFIGENTFGYLHQAGVEHFVNYLFNKL